MKKTILTLVFASLLLLTVTGTAFAETEPTAPKADANFNDVKESDWFYKYVDYVVGKGILSGISSENFSPNEYMTRGMFVTTLAKACGVDKTRIEDTQKFTDIDFSAYYGPYAVWATENGFMKGIDESSFKAGDSITRQQAAAILYRYMMKTNLRMPTRDESLAPFADMAEVSEYAVEAVDIMRKCRFMEGFPNGRYVPSGKITRAEAAAIFARFDYYQKHWEHFDAINNTDTAAEEGHRYKIEIMSGEGVKIEEISLNVGENVGISYETTPLTDAVTWSVDNPEIAGLNQIGEFCVVSAQKAGETIISIETADGAKDSVTLKVEK